LLATFRVTNTSDSGLGSLRQAILDANASPNAVVNNTTVADVIIFATNGASPFVIAPSTPLPAIAEAVVINGYSAAGAIGNDTTDDRDEQGDVAFLVVQIDGSSMPGTGADGLTIRADNSTVAGLMITGFDGAAIHLDGPAAVGNTLWGNFLGVTNAPDPSLNGWPIDATTSATANRYGIRVGGSNNRLGGTTPPLRNLIQGNREHGVWLEGSGGTGNLVEGNLILDNGSDGILIQSSNNFIGEAIGPGPAGGGNVISGNLRGVHIQGPGPLPGADARGNILLNNEIGTGVRLPNVTENIGLRGRVARPNRAEGVWIDDAPGNVIGGVVENSRNVIAGNDGHGIRISGQAATSNRVLGNWIGFNVVENVVSILPNEDGLRIESAANTVGGTVVEARNVVASNAGNGITLLRSAAAGNVIEGNYIGTILGGDDFGNTFEGISLQNAPDNTIGGTAAGASNVISANNDGVVLKGPGSTRNLLLGNLIGTASDGLTDLGNAVDGVRLQDAPGNTIGATGATARNVISGNDRGVRLTGTGTTANRIQNNAIGTDRNGTFRIGNARDGVLLEAGASGNTIGGASQGLSNRIAFNVGHGILAESGVGNAWLSNSIEANDGEGILLQPGANHNQPAPLLFEPRAFATRSTVYVSFVGSPRTSYLLQFFANDPPFDVVFSDLPDQLPTNATTDQSEGQSLVGSATVTMDDLGRPIIANPDLAHPGLVPITLSQAVAENRFLTATATLLDASLNPVETSDFSDGQRVIDLSTTVVNTRDQGPGSLRRALLNAGVLPGVDLVDFRIPGEDSGFDPGTLTWTIRTARALPIAQGIIIDGYTQRATVVVNGLTVAVESIPNSLATGNNARPRVILNGEGVADIGLDVRAQASIRGLIVDGFQTAISLVGAASGGSLIQGNFLGRHILYEFNPFQNTVTPRFVGTGNREAAIHVQGATGVVIGGTDPAARNVVAENAGQGVWLDRGSDGALIQGNYVGVAAANRAVYEAGNGRAGLLVLSRDNTIGGAAVGAGNVLAGNGEGGVWLAAGSAHNLVAGNLIGSDFTGLVGFIQRQTGNRVAGVRIDNSAENTIGGTLPGAGNLIVNNAAERNTGAYGDGVLIAGPGATGNRVQGNRVGTDLDGVAFPNQGGGVHIRAGASRNQIGGLAQGAANAILRNSGDGVWVESGTANAILSNRIEANAGLGIRQDPAANGDQPSPTIASVTTGGGRTNLFGTLAGAPRDAMLIQFFAVDQPDPSGRGEGPELVGEATVALDDTGAATLSVVLFVGVAEGRFVTATATRLDPLDLEPLDTSEFAVSIVVTSAAGTFYVTTTADTGPGSLRQAILDANASDGQAERIAFRIPGVGPQTILVRSALPAITDTLYIDGYSQARDASGSIPAGVLNTVVFTRDTPNDALNLRPQIEIRGSLAGASVDGLVFLATAGRSIQNSLVAGLILAQFSGDGIRIESATESDEAEGVAVVGSIIRQNAGAGVRIRSANNRVGDAWSSHWDTFSPVRSRNAIVGNRLGIVIEGPHGTGNRVEGNLIEANTEGGVVITTSNNTVGGPTGEGNAFIANGRGVVITSVGAIAGAFPQGNEVFGNRIGDTDRDGFPTRGNQQEGVLIEGAPGNRVGGVVGGNVILANGAAGVRITGTAATGNSIVGNRIGLDPGLLDRLPLVAGNLDGIRVESPGNLIGGANAGAGNVVSANRRHGIVLDGANARGNRVEGNLVGTDPTSLSDFGNTMDGLRIEGAPGNTIGGPGLLAGNTLSGNRVGLVISGLAASGNLVQGNRIGTDSVGGVDLGNSAEGLLISGAPDNTIGGTADGAGNLISGNNRGVRIDGTGATGNALQGNRIGTDHTGLLPLGNAIEGIIVSAGASRNTIGGAQVAAGNAIQHNLGIGVRVQSGSGNAIRSNSIDTNGGPGIALEAPGHANGLQPAPTLTAAIRNAQRSSVQGTLQAAPGTSFTIELFASPQPDPTGRGEGRTPLGTVQTTTDASGRAAFAAVLEIAIPAGQVVTATATSPGGDTSEFSGAIGASAVSLAFASATAEVMESEGTATLLVVRNGDPAGQVDVSYRIEGGVSGVLSFAPGEMSRPIAVPLSNDATPGRDRTVRITLSDPTRAATLGAPAVATLTIHDDDLASVRFASATYSVAEAAGLARLVVTRPGGIGAASVAYSTTAQGTARAGVDYTSVHGVLQFADGQTSQTFVVPIRPDAVTNGDRTIVLELSNPAGVALGSPSRATLTIRDDDRAGQLRLTAATATVREADGVVVLPVARVGGSTGRVSASYHVVNGDAFAGADFQPVTGTIVFEAGVVSQNIVIPILDDHLVEGNESFRVVLTDPAGGASLGVPAEVAVTILEDDRDDDGPNIRDVRTIVAGGAVTGIVLGFSEPLDTLRAEDLFNYDRAVTMPGRDGRFGTADDRRVALVSARYDAAADRVILTPASPLPVNTLYRVVVNHLTTPGAGSGVADRSGNLLDGDGDGRPGGPFVADVGAGTNLSYRNQDGDRVTLRLSQGGRMDLWLDADGEARRLSFSGTVARRSKLSGTLARSRAGNGRTARPALEGEAGVRVALKSPPFVNRVALRSQVGAAIASRRVRWPR
jgi:hypothetical protein